MSCPYKVVVIIIPHSDAGEDVLSTAHHKIGDPVYQGPFFEISFWEGFSEKILLIHCVTRFNGFFPDSLQACGIYRKII